MQNQTFAWKLHFQLINHVILIYLKQAVMKLLKLELLLPIPPKEKQSKLTKLTTNDKLILQRQHRFEIFKKPCRLYECLQGASRQPEKCPF